MRARESTTFRKLQLQRKELVLIARNRWRRLLLSTVAALVGRHGRVIRVVMVVEVMPLSLKTQGKVDRLARRWVFGC